MESMSQIKLGEVRGVLHLMPNLLWSDDMVSGHFGTFVKRSGINIHPNISISLFAESYVEDAVNRLTGIDIFDHAFLSQLL